MKELLVITTILILYSCTPDENMGPSVETPQASGDCTVANIYPTTQHPSYAPDGSKYLISKQDKEDGVFQIYVGTTGDTTLTCISNFESIGTIGSARTWEERNKVMVQWHPSGDYIICGVEKDVYSELFITPFDLRLGWIQSGLWLDIYALKPDGSEWYLLAPLQVGMTGPAFTPDGLTAVYADALPGSDLTEDAFGEWTLQKVEFKIVDDAPTFYNKIDISPEGARWLEPGNFHPDGELLLFNADIGMEDAQGQDQYILNISTSEVTNLTNSPEIWDEHGVFSPSGDKILMMSSYPYRDDPKAYKTLSLKTEFMIMDIDGGNLEQLTHFREEGFPEYHEGIASTGYWNKEGDKVLANTLEFPNYHHFVIEHVGNCGN